MNPIIELLRKQNKKKKTGEIGLILHPLANENEYYKSIKKIMSILVEQTESVLLSRLSRKDSFKRDAEMTPEEMEVYTELVSQIQSDLFSEQGIGEENDETIRNMIIAAGIAILLFGKKQVGKATKKLTGVPVQATGSATDTIIQAWAKQNYTLIKGLSEEYVKKINFIVQNGVINGTPVSDIAAQIKKVGVEMTTSRAELIAVDQTGTLHGQLIKAQNEELGIDMYVWRTMQDSRVRPTHRALEGKVCRWDDNYVYSEDGGETWQSRTGGMAKAIPGQELRCRCVSAMFIKE